MCAQGLELDDGDKNFEQGTLQGACKGDLGSPLVCYKSTQGNGFPQIIQTGISTMGLTCGAPKVPGVFTQLAGIKGWVRGQTKKYGKVQFRNAPLQN